MFQTFSNLKKNHYVMLKTVKIDFENLNIVKCVGVWNPYN